MIKQEEKGSATTFLATAGSADSVNVVIRIIGRVVLDNPVDFGEVKSTLRNICTEQNAGLRLAELQVSACAFLLLLLTVDVLHWHINVV